MHLSHGEITIHAVADAARFAEYRGVEQEVRGGVFRHVAARASGGCGSGIGDPTGGINYVEIGFS